MYPSFCTERSRATINRDRAKQTFLDYASHYDMNDPKIRLKVEHTLFVCALCERIAGSLSLSPEDTELMWLTGLLHDIGRFEQVRLYHTFRDSESVDHAQFGADLLFQKGLVRDYIDEDSFDGIIEKSIRNHNAYRLPEDLSDRERTFCQILRDADKIDILRVNRQTPMTQIYNLPEEAFLYSEISDPVFDDLLHHRDVNRKNSKTGIDFLMGHIAFVFGLVYPVSIEIIREQGYLDQMLAFESCNENTRRRMEIIRSEVRAYMQDRTRPAGPSTLS